MHAFVLQDFVTIRSTWTIATIAQSEHAWIDLSGYEDLIAWIDVREASLATGGTNIQCNLQTSPLRDEYLFVTMESSPLQVTAGLTAPSVRKAILAQTSNTAGAPIPLGRFLRWQLVANGTLTAGTWDITFRIVGCANAVASRSVAGFAPPAMHNMLRR